MPLLGHIAAAVLAFTLLIAVLISLHELGHYSVARMHGLVAKRFALGFGKPLWERTDRRGTRWTISPLLAGGYVQFDDTGMTDSNLEKLPRWRKATVVAAGPAVNLILGIAIFSILAAVVGAPGGKPLVSSVIPGSPAAFSGLLAGDFITAIDGRSTPDAAVVIRTIAMLPGVAVKIDFHRGTADRTTTATLASHIVRDDAGNSANIGSLGIILPATFERATSPLAALAAGVADANFLIRAQMTSIGQMISGKRSITEISGPVRIARTAGAVAEHGITPFAYLIALVSVAVGTFNLLPIPALDGGHLVRYAIEALCGRDLDPRASKMLAQIGMYLVMTLGAAAVIMDIWSISNA